MRAAIQPPRPAGYLVSVAILTLIGCTADQVPPDPVALYVSVFPRQLTLSQGASSSAFANLTRSGDFPGKLQVAVAGAPPGVTTAIGDVETTPTGMKARLTFSVGDDATPGVYLLKVVGTGLGVRDSADLVLSITCRSAGVLCEQWAATARASSEYTVTAWSAAQATGAPNVVGCEDNVSAWASVEASGVEWLELEYRESVRPTGIQVHESFGVSSIVRIEVKDDLGAYHTVYDATAARLDCPRILSVPVTTVTVPVRVVRVTLDQSLLQDWNEIDAVKLVGIR